MLFKNHRILHHLCVSRSSNPEEQLRLSGCNNIVSSNADLSIMLLSIDLRELKLNSNLGTAQANSFLSISSSSEIRDRTSMNELTPLSFTQSIQAVSYTGDTTSPQVIAGGFSLFDLNSGRFTLVLDEPVDVSSVSTPVSLFQHQANALLQSDMFVVQRLECMSPYCQNNETVTFALPREELNQLKQNSRICSSISTCWLTIPTGDFIRDMASNPVVPLTNGAPTFTRILTEFIDDTVGPYLESYVLNLTSRELTLNFDEPVEASSFNISGVSLLRSPNTDPEYRLTGGGMMSLTNTATVTIALSDEDVNAIQSRSNIATTMDNTYLILEPGVARDLSHSENMAQEITSANARLAANFVPDRAPPQILSFDLDLDSNSMKIRFSEPVLVSSVNLDSLILSSSRVGGVSYNITGGALMNTTLDASSEIVFILTNEDVVFLEVSSDIATSPSNTFIASQDGLASDTNSLLSTALPIADAIQVSSFLADQSSPNILEFSLDMNTGIAVISFDDPVLETSFDVSGVTFQSSLTRIPMEWHTLSQSSSVSSIQIAFTITIQIGSSDLNRLKQIRNLATNSANTYLTATASTVDDTSGTDVIAITDRNAIQVSQFISDNTRPTLESWTLDLNGNQIIMTFSETVDISTFQPIAVTIVAGQSSSLAYSLTGYDSLIPSNADSRLAIQLSRMDSNNIKLRTSLASGYSTSYIYISRDAIEDTNMNDVVAIASPNAIQALLYIADTTSPVLESFALNLNTGALALMFDEAVRASSLDVSAFTLVNRASMPNVLYRLADSSSSSSNGPLVTIQLSPNDLNGLKALTGLVTSASDTFLVAMSMGILDMNGTALRPISSDSALQVSIGNYIADTISPTLDEFILNVTSEELILTFSETVSTLVDPTQIVLQSQVSSSIAGTISLALMGGLISRPVGPVIVLRMLTEDANRLKRLRTLGISRDNTFVSIMGGAVHDSSGNPVIPREATNALQAELVIPDTIPPQLSSFSLDLYNREILLVFDETVDSGTFSATSVTLQDHPSNPVQLVTLEAFSRTDSPDGTDFAVILSPDDFNSITATFPLATMNDNTFIALAIGAVQDMAGIPSAEIPSTNALPITDHTQDRVRPSLSDFVLDLDNGVLTLTFNESVNVTSTDSTQITVQNSPSNATSMFTLTGGIVNQRDSTTIDINLLPNDFNRIKQLTDLATVVSNTYLSLTAATISDMNRNPVLALSMSNARLSRNVELDITPPQVLGFDLDYNSGDLTIFLDETVNLATFQPGAISFQTSMTSQLFSHIVQNASTTNTGVQPVIFARLSEEDLNELKRLRICVTLSECYMSVSNNLVMDVFNVPNAPVLPSSSIGVGIHNRDITRPELMQYSVFDLDSGSFMLEFTETVDLSTLNDTQITFENDYANASIIIQIYQLGYSGDDSNLVTFNINPTNLNELKLLPGLCTYDGNCWIRFSEGFLRDVSGNSIVEIRPNTINTFHRPRNFIPDTTPPVLLAYDFDLDSGALSFTFNEVVILGTFYPMNITFQDAAVPSRMTNLRYFGHSSRTSDGLGIYWNMTTGDLNLLKSHEFLFSSPSNSYLTHAIFIEDISGTAIANRDVALEINSFIPDTTRPFLQYFSAFNFDNGTFTLQFDEPVNISTLSIVDGLAIAGNSTFSLNIYDREYINDWYSVLYENGTIYNLTHSFIPGEYVLNCPFSLIPTEMQTITTMMTPSVVVRVNNSEFMNGSGNFSGSGTSDIDGSGSASDVTEPPATMDYIEVSFYPLSLRGCEIYRNLTVIEPFHILTGGNISYIDERKQQILITLNRHDLRILKLSFIFASNDADTWIAYNETDLKDFANNYVKPMNLFNSIKLQDNQFVDDVTSPSFESAVLDMDAAVLSLNFNDVMDVQSVHPVAIEISEYPGSNNSYILQGPYPHPLPLSVDIRDNYTISIPLSFDDMNELKNNFDLATSDGNTYITFQRDIASDIYGRYPDEVNGVPVAEFIPDRTGPQVLSFSIDYSERIMNVTFNEVVNPVFGEHQRIIIQNVRNMTAVPEFTSYRFTEGGISVENFTGVSTLQLMLDIDLNALIIDSNLGSSINNTFLVLQSGTFYDQNNNTNQIITSDSALQVTSIVENISPPTLLYFDLNLNDNYLLLKFSEAVVPETFNTSALTLLSSPSSQQRITFDQNSRISLRGFNSIILVHFTIQDEEEVKNPSTILAESAENTYLSIEQELAENYVGFNVIRISEMQAIPVRLYFEG